MSLSVLLVAAGLVLLVIGGDILVRGISGLAIRLGVSALLVGVVIAGFGTSTPELVTSLQAASAHSAGIAYGNIVGSNIANILLILGLSALVTPIACRRGIALREGLIVLAVAAGFTALVAGGVYGRMAGIAGIAALVVYLVMMVRSERMSASSETEIAQPSGLMHKVPVLVGMTMCGLVLLLIGGKALVTGALDLARDLGVSDNLIGLTIVAVGTSLPELVTSLVAALRRQGEIALGNIIGSNIYNLLFIGGVTAIASPATSVPEVMLAFDLPVMLAASLLLILFAATGRGISRLEGGLMLAGYGGYLWWLV